MKTLTADMTITLMDMDKPSGSSHQHHNISRQLPTHTILVCFHRSSRINQNLNIGMALPILLSHVIPNVVDQGRVHCEAQIQMAENVAREHKGDLKTT